MEGKSSNIELEILKHRTQCKDLFLLKGDFVKEIRELKDDISKDMITTLSFVKTRASRGLVIVFITIFGLLLGASGTIIYANFDLYDKLNDKVTKTKEELKEENALQNTQIELNKYVSAQILTTLEDINVELKAMRQDRISDLKSNKVSVKGGSNDSNSR